MGNIVHYDYIESIERQSVGNLMVLHTHALMGIEEYSFIMLFNQTIILVPIFF